MPNESSIVKEIMKKISFILWLLSMVTIHSYSQNYISGTVSLHGDNTASGATTVAPGASLKMNKNSFYEQGAFINQGDSTAISADSGTLVLNGTKGQTITGRFKVGALLLDNAAGAFINNTEPNTIVTILDYVGFGNVSNAKFNTGNNLLTLRSTALKTARIADLTHKSANAGNAINGKVTVERYIPERRAWRLFCSPVAANEAPTINACLAGRRNQFYQRSAPGLWHTHHLRCSFRWFRPKPAEELSA